MRYEIRVTALGIITRTLDIDADSPSEAGKKAIALAKKDGGPHGWDLDDIYDDGKPHSRICAVDGTDEDGEEYYEDDLTPEE